MYFEAHILAMERPYLFLVTFAHFQQFSLPDYWPADTHDHAAGYYHSVQTIR